MGLLLEGTTVAEAAILTSVVAVAVHPKLVRVTVYVPDTDGVAFAIDGF